MNIYQISDRYTYLKESSIKHNKKYLFSKKKGQYLFDENLSIYYRSSEDLKGIEIDEFFKNIDSEPEAIIKACEWVLEELRK